MTADDAARVEAERAWRVRWPDVARSPLYEKGWDDALAWRAAQLVVVSAEQVQCVAADPRIKRVYEYTGVDAAWLVRFVLEAADITVEPTPGVVTAEQAWDEGYTASSDDRGWQAQGVKGRTANPYRITVEPTP